MRLADIDYNKRFEKKSKQYPQGKLQSFLPSWITSMSKTHYVDCTLWIWILEDILMSGCINDHKRVAEIVERNEKKYARRIADSQELFNLACKLCFQLGMYELNRTVSQMFKKERDSNEE